MNYILSFGISFLWDVPWQDGPYGATSNFQTNYFFSGGLGYWFFFLILALAAAIWLYYDSDKRKLDATAWRIGAFIAVGLLLPSLLFKMVVRESEVYQYFDIQSQINYLMTYQDTDGWRHTVDDLQMQLNEAFHPLTGMIEPIMFLGILGGIGGPVLAAAYFVTFQGQMGSSVSGEFPPSGQFVPPPPPPRPGVGVGQPEVAPLPPRPKKPKAHAWLVSGDGRSYQLNQGDTTLGRAARNDIQLGGDTTLSKRHAKIVEQNSHFRFHDLGSTNGCKVNGRRVRQPVLLAPDDEIQLGDNTILRFVTTQT
ncbi:MAG: FHA domain-containing protein [Chloroflexi bacterium]|nr:FHA domain-containing protein [Chloroflexota bacterium]